MTTVYLTQSVKMPQAEVSSREVKAYLKEIGLAAQRHMARGMGASGGGNIYTQELRTRGRGPGRQIFPVGPRTPHQASRPGMYPAVDTNRLRMQTTNPAMLDISGAKPYWTLIWGTPTPYSKWLAPADEGGEARGPKRMFMRHAVDSTIENVDPPENLIKWVK